MTAKVFCWKVKVTWRCGCHDTGNTIHICNSTMSNCQRGLMRKQIDRDCEDCMLEDREGRNLGGRGGSSNDKSNEEKKTVQVALAGEGPVVEGSAARGSPPSVAGQLGRWESIEPPYSTETGRKIVTA